VPTAVRCFAGSDGQAAALVSGGTPPYSYAWNAPSTDSVATGLIAGGYEVTVTDSRQCTAVSAPVTVLQPSTPVSLTAAQTRTACYGVADGEASASAAGGNGQPFAFAWSNGQTGPTAGGLAMGIHTVTVSDLLGCTATQSVEIQQFDSISVLIITVPPSCFGISDGVAAINLVEGGAGQGDTLNYHYQWSRPGAPDATVVTGLEGGQTYGLTVTDLQGCSGTVSFNILPKEQIAVSFTTQDVSCAGYSDGEICVSAVTGGFPVSAYAWSDGSAGPCLIGMPAGAYGVTVTNSEGCQTDSTITIVEPLPLALALAVEPLVCPYDSTGVVAAQVQGGTMPYSYQWNPGGADAQLTGLGPGAYFLTLTDAHGCQLTDSAVLVQPPAPAIAVTATDPSCFGGRNGRIRLEISGGLPPYRYRLNDDPFGGTATFIGLTAGIYRIQVRDGNDCITTLHDTLQQPIPIEINLGPDTTILLGDSLAITAEVSNAFGLVEYAWKSSIVEDLTCLDPPDCSSIQVGPYQATTYRVTVVDENNCRGESSIRVVVEKPRGIFVPTGFSPNGDPQNRRLIVHGISRTVREVVTFRVFDRWGELVYEDHNFPVNDSTRGWDGQFRGQDCDPAVYAWVAEVEYLDGYREIVKGNTTLIR
jgi:gliding motility-associated-like protein